MYWGGIVLYDAGVADPDPMDPHLFPDLYLQDPRGNWSGSD
jgi:hypothetical protein